MAHFAEINESGAVLRVIVIHNNELLETGIESEAKGISFCQSLFPNTLWVQASYNATFRKNYPGVGYVYDRQRDAFIPTQTYPSWILNEDTCLWDAPILYPTDGKLYNWDEPSLSWVEVTP